MPMDLKPNEEWGNIILSPPTSTPDPFKLQREILSNVKSPSAFTIYFAIFRGNGVKRF